MPQSPFEILRALQRPRVAPVPGMNIPAPTPSNGDPTGSASLYGFQNALRDETQGRLRAAQGTNDPLAIQRLTGLLSDQEDDINESPIAQQQTEYDARRAAINTALSQGFGGDNPTGEAAAYGRGVEQQKINAPIEQQRIASRGDIQKEEIASKGRENVAQINSDADYNALQKLLSLQGGNGLAPGARVSVSGVGSVSAPAQRRPTVAPSTLKALQDAHAAWKQAEQRDKSNWMPDSIFGIPMQQMQAPARKAAYDSALGAVFGSFQAHPEIKKLAGLIAADPELAGLDLNTALAHPKVNQNFDLEQMDDTDYQQLNDLLLYVRGLPGQQ